MALKKGGLGRGLDAIFDENSDSDNMVTEVSISEIEPNKNQPRKSFEEIPIAELADSIKQHGVLQPLIVREKEKGRYEIVAGERRWRASRMAGLTEIPVIIKDITDSEAMELALIENLQRENLNIIEEAMGYKILSEEHGYTQDEISQKVGKSRPAITNALRLLKLPDSVIESVKEGKITSGHARALLSLDNEEKIKEAAGLIVKKGLSVRETENLTKLRDKKEKTKGEGNDWGESFYKELQLSLENSLGQRVKIKHKNDKGIVEISFSSKEEIEKIAEIFADKTN